MFDSNQFFSGGAAGFYPKTIDQSLRFNDNDSAYLSRTPASAGNRKTWTFSCWVKRANVSTASSQFVLSTHSGGAVGGLWFNSSTDIIRISDESNGIDLRTNAVYRDPSAWYHIVYVVDTTQATASNRAKLYVNGEQVTSFSTATYPSQDSLTYVNNSLPHGIGYFTRDGGGYLDGYLAEVHFTDGTAYTADSFGELKSGVWVAKAPSVTYGTNGFYLDFANSADIGNDVSGEGNDWTPNNFTASDVVLDSPTDNFATWNPLFRGGEKSSSIAATSTLSDGNLKVSVPTNSYMGATMRPTSGQYYCEATIDTVTNEIGWGWIQATEYSATTAHAGQANKWGAEYSGYAPADIFLRDETTAIAQPTITLSNGDVIQWAWDIDAGKGWIGVNNSWYDSSGGTTGNPATGANPTFTFTADEAENLQVYVANGTSTAVFTIDFGQLGFTYTPPSGFLALSTANLPDPVIDPAQDASPEDYFNTVLYTGDGADDRAITGVGFQPDFVWIKNRSSAYSHYMFDVLRGTDRLSSNNTQAEITQTTEFKSFDSDGFTVDTDVGTNESSSGHVAWNWKANGSGVSNTDGTITSTVSANTTSGFSIVSYTGTGSAATVGHGLNSAPDMVITKNRDTDSAWMFWCNSFTGSELLLLNGTGAKLTDSSVFNGTVPSSSVFSVGTNYQSNGSGNNLIAYCFHSVEGFSKFGSYTGTGSSRQFVYTGFRPAFIICKNTSGTGNWIMHDTKRDAYNLMIANLYPNLSSAEGNTNMVDALSNGFEVAADFFGDNNASGSTYIYMAFAENPFKYSNAR